MLSTREQLRKLTITVEQLLDHSARNLREWDGVCTRVWVLTPWQLSLSSEPHKMGTLCPRVHPFWSLSTGGSVGTVIHRRRGTLALIA